MHRQSLQKNENEHECNVCQSRFDVFRSLIRHFKQKHPDKAEPSMTEHKARDVIICLLPGKDNNKIQCQMRIKKDRISRHVKEYHKCKKPEPAQKHQFNGFESSDNGKTWNPTWKKFGKADLTNSKDSSDSVEVEEVEESEGEEEPDVDVEVQEVLEEPLKLEINHHNHNKASNSWIEGDALANPKIKFGISVDHEACKFFGIKFTTKTNKRTWRGMADTGAAYCMGDQNS